MDRAIILAAGRGSRMRPFTDKLPKCRTKFFGKELIEWQLDALYKNSFNSSSIGLIRGYLKDTFDFNLTYFENPIWDKSNMVRTLTFAMDWAKDGNTLISYADIVYSPEDVSNLIDNSTKDISILYDPNWEKLWRMRFDNPLEDAETFIHDGDRLLNIGEKTDDISNIQGQYMGLLYFTPKGWKIFESYVKSKSDNEINSTDCTTLLRELISLNVDIGIVAAKKKWFEFDSESDLKIYLKNNLGEKIF